MKHRVTSLLLVGLVTVIASCRSSDRASEFATLDADATALRAAFNAGAGKVRVLMLVSPT